MRFVHNIQRAATRHAGLRFVLICAVIAVSPAAAQAQISLFNSNGFEPPTFAPGVLASYYGGGTGGQQNYLTTDFNQLLGSPAGTIQTALVQSGTQAFRINGSQLFDDTSFGGQTFWYRNYPTAATAFNPVVSGTPIVRVNYNQYVSSVPLNLNEMPVVGTYMEGYSQVGSAQGIVGQLMLNQNGGVTAMTVNGNFVNTANNYYTHDAWHSLQVEFNFASQTYRAFLDGNPVTFGASLVNVPFRNSNGPTDRIAEYGFQAAFNEATTVTNNNAYFDNYSIVATPVPEPSSLLFGGVALIGLRLIRRRPRN